MVHVYWLEQTEADVPANEDWLSASELLRLDAMRIPKRRAEWRLGRWTAKHAAAAYLNLPGNRQALAAIEIRPATSGAPEVFLANKRAGVTISLSHRSGTASCAVAQPGINLGCDLEVIEPRSDAFVADYFTPQEQAWVAQESAENRPLVSALLWSGKESALKALCVGLRLDTRSLTVTRIEATPSRNEDEHSCLDTATLALRPNSSNSWRPLRVACFDGRVFHGWWQQTGNLLRTLVAAPPPVAPVLLNLPSDKLTQTLANHSSSALAT